MSQTPIIIACDFASRAELEIFLQPFGSEPLFLKIGMELYYKEGNSLVQELKERGYKVFLDLKLHDIPNTVAQALRSLAQLDVEYITVHATGGAAMLKAASEAVQGSKTKLLAVTVLTSISEESLQRDLGVVATLDETVMAYAKMAQDNGIDGVICSPHETAAIRAQAGTEFAIVTPGIRDVNDATDDQARVATPEWALEQGATELVIGRSITGSKQPLATYMNIKERIK
ncbi:orotidine-5'-phosphate decarboxylase [Culicoidibacter larvae]|uniref:Orotidine 5'-phosphate decarboxylase n=1 Tax=Culicoidibacter larvae TaxID=2579976 RepID=A0A5R8QDH3_9FIRM|nr:orotidine-5'-phosphate decarboxylase [Culicoidibacter larvae]TLG73807.1 orotidine-5'-phosphate decarboxylase [Culicoidibacter larvae]